MICVRNWLFPSPGLFARWALALLPLWGAAVTASAQTYSNPLVTSGFAKPGGSSSGPADPCVLEFEGSYYVYPTGSGFSYKVMGSDNLVDWTGNTAAFSMPGGSPWKTWQLWAPDVQYINGRFYLYYTAGTGDISAQHIGVADCAVPTGPFTDQSYNAPLISDASIDAHCFQDGNDLYLYYVKFDGNLSTWVRKMLTPLTIDTSVPPQLCVSASVPWEATVNEGPMVIKRAGKYYLFYSGNYAHTADYGVGVAVADHPLGPWTKQPAPFNPVFKRNNSINLWGPGHGHAVTGPDGLSDWYVYHHKTEQSSTHPDGSLNYYRLLALDRLVPVAQDNSPALRFTSSGGTTAATPRPRMPFEYSNFHTNQLPGTFAALSGTWTVTNKKVSAPSDGLLQITRPLLPGNLQDFQFEWWLQANSSFQSGPTSAVEFSFEMTRQGQAYRVGFQIRPALSAVQFVEVNQTTGATSVIASTPMSTLDWRAQSRRITVRKNGSAWQFLLDRTLIASVSYGADLGWKAYVRTVAMPAWLDGYRQTIGFVDDFECSSCPADCWIWSSGSWSFVSPTSTDDGHLRQTRKSGTWNLAVLDGVSLSDFDLSADLLLKSQGGIGTSPRYGLVHSLKDLKNYAMVLVDPPAGRITTTAIINDVWQASVNSTVPLPATFSAADYHHLAVTTDAGQFVYSLNGLEMLRRSYTGLSASGQAGLTAQASEILVDNFSFTGSVVQSNYGSSDWDGDGVPNALDNCPYDANPQQQDSDADGVGDLCDSCAGTIPGATVGALGCPSFALADLDRDGDVDQSDFGIMQLCLAGQNLPAEACARARMDDDGDVDGTDMSLFIGCLSGTNAPADPNCPN